VTASHRTRAMGRDLVPVLERHSKKGIRQWLDDRAGDHRGLVSGHAGPNDRVPGPTREYIVNTDRIQNSLLGGRGHDRAVRRDEDGVLEVG
jgi:hypothetical protein